MASLTPISNITDQGSATPMHGKSLTCRKVLPKHFGGLCPQIAGSETLKKWRMLGKSQTCRTPAWQSHYIRSASCQKAMTSSRRARR